MDTDFLMTLQQKFAEARKMEPAVLVLRGVPKAFSVGASRQALLELPQTGVDRYRSVFEEVLTFPVPVIAAMEGHAVGGGLMLGLCCDMVLLAMESRYGAPFMNYGLTPGAGATYLLMEAFGSFLANEMMFSGRIFRGSELSGIDCRINRIVPRPLVLAEARTIADQIGAKNRDALKILKETLSARKTAMFHEAFDRELTMHGSCFLHAELKKTIEENYPAPLQ